MMGFNIPRPWKRPPTPPIYEPPEMPKTAPAKMHDQPFGSRTNAALNDGSTDLEISFRGAFDRSGNLTSIRYYP